MLLSFPPPSVARALSPAASARVFDRLALVLPPRHRVVSQYLIGIWRGGTPIGICVEEFFRVQVREPAVLPSSLLKLVRVAPPAAGALKLALNQRACGRTRAIGRSTVRSRRSRMWALALATPSGLSR